MSPLLCAFVLLAPVHAFVLPSALATPRKSIACVAQQPSGSGEQMVSRRSMAGHAAVCAAVWSPSLPALTTLSLTPCLTLSLSLTLTLTLTRWAWQR